MFKLICISKKLKTNKTKSHQIIIFVFCIFLRIDISKIKKKKCMSMLSHFIFQNSILTFQNSAFQNFNKQISKEQINKLSKLQNVKIQDFKISKFSISKFQKQSHSKIKISKFQHLKIQMIINKTKKNNTIQNFKILKL